VGNSLGSVSCNDGDSGKLITTDGTWTNLGDTQGYAHNITPFDGGLLYGPIPVNDGLACSVQTTSGGKAGGWRVYVGTYGDDAAQDFCNQLQHEFGKKVVMGNAIEQYQNTQKAADAAG
jgi:hypothetical protein